ncbi:DUF1707 domain-containing protein [Nocardia sp. NPDC006630]|uniref:DUF1707 SHOCT-like domain-containing protein n=1 Tax=Nocardia sp. NPDC006630 TaxID=3157181 RepID=UPI0033B48084
MAENRNQGMRARDSDRVDACALLDNARAQGELTEAEHARRTADAMQARTFGALDVLISDLQIPRNLVGTPLLHPPRRNSALRWKIAAGALSVALLAGALGGCLARATVSKPAMPDATTPAGLASFLAAYRNHYGDAVADEVTLFPTYVVVERRVGQTDTSDRIRYDGGFDSMDNSTRMSGTDSIDLATLDLPKLAGLIAGAPQTLSMPGRAVSHIDIEHRTGKDPVVGIYVANGSKTGNLQVSLQGEPIQVNLPQ